MIPLSSSGNRRKRDIPQSRSKCREKVGFYILINHRMALSKEQELCLEEIKQETKRFEASLRTSFNTRNPDNHVAIQRVNNECIRLKTKVQGDSLCKSPEPMSSGPPVPWIVLYFISGNMKWCSHEVWNSTGMFSSLQGK